VQKFALQKYSKQLNITRQKIYILLTSLFAISLVWNCPEHTEYFLPKNWFQECTSFVLLALAVFYCADKNIFQKIRIAFSQKIVLLAVGFSIWNLCAYYTQGVTQFHLSFLESKWSIGVMAIIFCSEKKWSAEEIKIILKCFVLSVLAAIIYCEAIGISEYFKSNPPNHHRLMYELLSIAIMMPALLCNMMLASALWLCMPYFSKIENGFSKPWNIFLFIIHLIFLAQLMLKTVFIFVCLFIIWFVANTFLQQENKQTKLLKSIAAIASLIILLGTVFILNKQRLTEVFTSINTGANVQFAQSINSRLAAWCEAGKAFQQEPWLGYGAGKANLVLQNQLAIDGYTDLVKHKMRTHNQFLNIVLSYGLIGLLVFLFLLASIAKKFTAQKNLFAIWLFIWCIIALCTNDVLENNAGVHLFFGLFFIFTRV
jgi:O-antigen ligase